MSDEQIKILIMFSIVGMAISVSLLTYWSLRILLWLIDAVIRLLLYKSKSKRK